MAGFHFICQVFVSRVMLMDILKWHDELFQHWREFLGSCQKEVDNFTLFVLDRMLEFQNSVTFKHFVYWKVFVFVLSGSFIRPIIDHIIEQKHI